MQSSPASPAPPPSGVELSIIIPVYNNAATLDELLDRIVAVMGKLGRTFEVVLVDDGSRDESLAVLQNRAARDARIRPFALVRNFGGQAAACAALDQVRGRRVLSMDADLENCPEDIPAFLAQLDGGSDMVCGYRALRRAPWLTRRLPSLLMNTYVRRQTGASIRDLGCGMRAFEGWIVRDLEAEGEARRLLTPLLLRRARHETEVPLTQGAKHKSGGHSFMSLLGIAVDYYLLTARRPFLLSGLASLGAIALGTIVCVVSRAHVGGLIVLMSGLLGLPLSLVGEYCQRLYQLGQKVPFYILRELEPAAARNVESVVPAASQPVRSAVQHLDPI
jgi:glycosyltransferase involved in cell wall biosynthesis